ncbi:MAG: alpha/beta fold hydrolase [Prolixibacteraceae bacterium]|nr:alpha/beta fold hydrolase [Prolixibacteraceae bacterium]
MKNFKFYHSYLILFIFAGLFLNSCKDNNTPEPTSYEYYLSSELKTQITSQEAAANFIKAAPEAVAISPLIRFDVEVHKITYKTTFKGKNIQASGLVCFPKAAGNYPILSFQNGTNTLYSDAPSVSSDNDMFSIMESVTSMGFIVVIPDYIGFGASENIPHPYLDAKSSTQSILDMIRAAKEYSTDAKVLAKASKDLFIFGYSQGGWATMQLQKTIEKDYSSEFNLKASSCGAGPYSIEYMNKYIVDKIDYPMPYFLAYLLNSYDIIDAFTNPLTDFIQAPYAAKIPGLFDGMHSGGAINAELTTQMANFLTPEYRAGYATDAKFASARSAFLSNSITAWNATTPMKLFHGADDDLIPSGISQKMLADFKTAGMTDSKIQLVIIPDVGHTTGIYPTGMQTILWFLSLLK